MTSLSHALIGTAIAAKIPNLYIAAPIALTAHFLCDMIPHWDLGTNWRDRSKIITGILAIFETLFSIFATYFIFIKIIPQPSLLFIVIIFSLIPDWLEAPYFIFYPHAPKIFHWFYKIQSKYHARLIAPWGIFTQLITVAIFLFVGFIL